MRNLWDECIWFILEGRKKKEAEKNSTTLCKKVSFGEKKKGFSRFALRTVIYQKAGPDIRLGSAQCGSRSHKRDRCFFFLLKCAFGLESPKSVEVLLDVDITYFCMY